jgi:transposase
MMTLPILGIDISKTKFDAVLFHEGKYRHRVFSNKEQGFAKLREWLLQLGFASVHACLEATGTYGDPLARFLHQAGHHVSIVNPARIKAFAMSELSRTKTDKTDAYLIARFCFSQQPKLWTPPPLELTELQALVRRLENLQDMHQQESNRLSSEILSKQVLQSVTTHLEYLDQEIQKTKKLIKNHIDQHPTLKNQRDLLTSIPGIADATAAKLLAELQNFKSYSSARQVAAYAGLTPQHHLSGSSVHRKARLSKTGNTRLRKSLYMPAIVAKQHNPIIKTFCERLKERGKNNMTIIGAAMRKLLHIVYGVLKSGKPFNPNYQLAA